MSDLISRQAAIELIENESRKWGDEYGISDVLCDLSDLPSAQPEVKPIGYEDCANAMMMMWMDKVITDGEYGRIMDKLNAHWKYCPNCGADMRGEANE